MFVECLEGGSVSQDGGGSGNAQWQVTTQGGLHGLGARGVDPGRGRLSSTLGRASKQGPRVARSGAQRSWRGWMGWGRLGKQ